MIGLLAALALPACAAQNSLLRSRPAAALVNETIELKPVDGHHFNLEAPQKCGSNRADEVLPRRFRCQIKASGKVAVLVSICDDAKTFCRQERFEVEVRGVSAQAAASSPAQSPPRGGKRAPEGFIDNEPSKALALARREGRLLFIDFYGIWCPPCNELEEHAYPDPSFQAAAADFVKIGLDADAEISFDWKARFKVGGYPTLIVADADLRELGRVVGYRTGPSLAQFLREAKSFQGEPAEQERLRAARRHAQRGEFDEVDKTLSGIAGPDVGRERLLARRERARREEDQAADLAAAKELAAVFPNDPQFSDWALAIAEADQTAGAALRQPLRRSVEYWSSSAALAESGYGVADLISNEASFFEALGSTDEARALWSKAADAYATQAAQSPLKVPRAANLGRAEALSSAGRKAEALALYAELAAAYPDEFTFNYEYASALKDDSQAADAFAYAVKAERSAYGDNWLRAVRLKAELELKLDRAKDAAKTVDDALAQVVMPKSSDVRTGRYLLALRRLRETITASCPGASRARRPGARRLSP
ncbi:MAG: hypothetical protein A2X37_09870 [Elusimicrobia bacterium GWA2_66_18]|nr:MAG: hypothetical protein A2X37_09870 [Elusimicrobia bacterium GWA2_66_18]